MEVLGYIVAVLIGISLGLIGSGGSILTVPNGAVGVFQLMPSTARRLGVNPYYLSDNIKGGLMYYKKLYNMFGSTELALAAYNAGPGVVKRYKKVPKNSKIIPL